MNTCYDNDVTALSMLNFEPPSDYRWAPAWSSSELGDPAVDDVDFFHLVEEYRPEVREPRPTSGVAAQGAVAAALLGGLGVGALLGVAVLSFAGSATASQAVVAPGLEFAAATATPRPAAGRYPSVTISVPTPAVPPAPTALAVSGFPPAQPVTPTVTVLPCNPQPFCI